MAALGGALALALASMAGYRLSGDGLRSAKDTTGRGGSFVLGFWVRNWFYWIMRPVTRASVGLRLTPFFFNVLAVACGAASMLCYATAHLPSAGWLVLASGIADVLDGEVARATETADARGAFLDSTLDRFSEFAVFVGLAALFASGWGSVLVATALGGSLLVSYTRARGESLGVLCKVGIMQRAERMLLLGIGSIVDPTVTSSAGWSSGAVVAGVVVVIAAGTVLTSIYRTVWIARALRGR